MITLIWQTDYSSAWERDWIEYLFSKTPHVTIYDKHKTQYIDSSMIIYNASVDNKSYIKNLSQSGKKFGLIHLSDEWSRDDTDIYQYADVVLRNYYRDTLSDVITFPLGWMRTFPYDITPKTVDERKYTWSFSGHVDKTTRPMMAKYMSQVPNGRSYFKQCGQDWGAFEGHALNPVQLAEMYNDSIFVPCPQGNESIDSLRVCEALQVGAFPIVEASDYWSKLYGDDHPLIQINDWSQAPWLITEMLRDPIKLEIERAKARQWWVNHCEKLQERLTTIL